MILDEVKPFINLSSRIKNIFFVKVSLICRQKYKFLDEVDELSATEDGNEGMAVICLPGRACDQFPADAIQDIPRRRLANLIWTFKLKFQPLI